MMNFLRKPTVMGFVAGATLVLLLNEAFHWLIRLAWPTPVFAITLTWQENLQFLSRSALPGGLLGTLTLAGIATWRNGEAAKAKRMYLLGGLLMFSIVLARIVFDLWSLLHTGQYVIGVPGPPTLSWQVRVVSFDLLLNLPLQWSLFLLLAGVWPTPKRLLS